MTEGGPAGGAQARGDQDRHRGHLPAHPRAEEARQGLSGKGQQDSLTDQLQSLDSSKYSISRHTLASNNYCYSDTVSSLLLTQTLFQIPKCNDLVASEACRTFWSLDGSGVFVKFFAFAALLCL